jgi:hypothetical protein
MNIYGLPDHKEKSLIILTKEKLASGEVPVEYFGTSPENNTLREVP